MSKDIILGGMDEPDPDDIFGKERDFDPYIDKDERTEASEDISAEDEQEDSEKPGKKKKKSRKTPKRNRSNHKRNYSTPQFLTPTDYQLEQINKGLREFYKNNPNFLKNNITVDQQIANVIDDCKKGWVCAPNDFMKRVQWKTKWNTESLQFRKDYNESYANAKQIQLSKEIKKKTKSTASSLGSKHLISVLAPDEQKIWLEMEERYRTEFEFNASSDAPLLAQCLTEELTQLRLQRRRLLDPYDDIEFQLSESYKRLLAAQKALGITREQREAANTETEGNVATLSKNLEEKQKIMAQLEEKQLMEEQALQLKHESMEGLSILSVPELAEDLRKAHEGELLDVTDITGINLHEEKQDKQEQDDVGGEETSSAPDEG